MATPRIFVSSTCYDLKYIRENLKYFIKTVGYEPVLSEEGTVFFNPSLHTHDACLAEVPNCQIFVLIIGGRFGGKSRDSENSITNEEYKEAVKLKIPIFALVDSSVYHDHYLYKKNYGNPDVDLAKLIFPAVDSIKIFNFIDEVRSNSINNALVPFRDFGEIESYLKHQWAGMMFDFLSRRSESQRLVDTFTHLASINERVEMLSKQILVSVGTEDAKIDAKLYEEMLASEAIRDLAYWGIRPTPSHVLINSSFRSCAKSLGVNPDIREVDEESISGGGWISKSRFMNDSRRYKDVRNNLLEILTSNNMKIEDYIAKRPHIEVEKKETSGHEEDA